MEWITDRFPPNELGFRNVSIEVEVKLENRKIVPAIYAPLDKTWHLAEGKYPVIKEKVLGWRKNGGMVC